MFVRFACALIETLFKIIITSFLSRTAFQPVLNFCTTISSFSSKQFSALAFETEYQFSPLMLFQESFDNRTRKYMETGRKIVQQALFAIIFCIMMEHVELWSKQLHVFQIAKYCFCNHFQFLNVLLQIVARHVYDSTKPHGLNITSLTKSKYNVRIAVSLSSSEHAVTQSIHAATNRTI